MSERGGRTEAPGDEFVGHAVLVVIAQYHEVALVPAAEFDQAVEAVVFPALHVDLLLGEREPAALGLAEPHDEPCGDLGLHVAKGVPKRSL